MLYRLDRLIGDSAMSTILHQWVSMHRRQPASTAQFVTLATRVSGRDLSGLFEPWLFQPGKPAAPARTLGIRLREHSRPGRAR